ncbi:MAG: carboxypeptidase-like regulatory domain-containing protein [Saprospiraceae bacterium]|nr:carboxypeptidase-like regulatory domain-containing protein [Saprospiraceae bacterium]
MTRILIFLFIFTSVSLSSAQAVEVLSRRLTITFNQTPIKEALDEVARQADFEWSYNARILSSTHRVTLQARDWTVREILREMLGENYVVKSSGRHLILKKEKPPQSELSGVIRANGTDERLANVTIYDKKTLRATTTDSTGYYKLKVKKKSQIVVTRLGYRDTLLQVASLTPRYQNLNLKTVDVPVSDTPALQLAIRRSLQKAATELDYFFNTQLDNWHELNVPDTFQRRFQISFLPGLGTNHVLSAKVANDYSINVLAGHSSEVRVFEVAGLGNFTRNKVQGFQAAGLFNLNRGNCTGVQAAGIYNLTADTLTGVQLAGIMNVAHCSPQFSVQAAGLINIVRNEQKSSSDIPTPKAVQAAGLINHAQNLDGAQISGLLNTAKKVNGAQVGGMLNIASEVNGVQVSGLINHTRRIRGVQIGVINSAKTGSGIQIGLLNRSGKRVMPIINWIKTPSK